MTVIDHNIHTRALRFAVDQIDKAITKHGGSCTFEHIMAELAEAATRQLPEGSHFLRNAVSEADAATAISEANQAAWTCCKSFRGERCKKGPVVHL